MAESEVLACRTRKATKAELKTAEENAEKDLWRTYHKHLGEDGKKKGMSFARDGSARMSKVKKPGE